MEQNPLRLTLDTLRREGANAEQRVAELRDELDNAETRLVHIRGAIANIEPLLGEPSSFSIDDDAHILPIAPQAESPSGAESDEEPQLRKRVPSTEWVAEVVSTIGAPATRDTIYAKFEELKGIPDSWVAPRNSFNNALGRAVERNLVQKLNDNLFAPKDYEPTSSSDEGGR